MLNTQEEIIVLIQITYNFKKMKKIITLFISILFMIGCNTNKSKIETDLEKRGFKGKVKSIKSTTYKAI